MMAAEDEDKAPPVAEAAAAIVVSVIIPCFNEAAAIAATIDHLAGAMAGGPAHELLVVDDGSTDGSPAAIAAAQARHPGLRVITHPRNLGYGAALKTGLRQAQGKLVAITDADGTYPNHRLPELVERCRDFDMVVGARTGANVRYSKLRATPKYFLRRWVSWLARRQVPDINSGMRVFRREPALKFFGLYPDGFSFTITITLAMLTTSHLVDFVPIDYAQRVGRSKIKPFRDTARFIKIILRTGTYFAPVRAFMPLFVLLLALMVVSLGYDVLWLVDLTERSMLCVLAVINTGLFILIADLIDKRSSRW